LLARTARVETATAEVMWQDRGHAYARSWESRVLPIIDLLEQIKA
jgi:hypothetical protein